MKLLILYQKHQDFTNINGGIISLKAQIVYGRVRLKFDPQVVVSAEDGWWNL